MVVAPESSQPAGAAMSNSDGCGPITESTAAPFEADDDTGSDTGTDEADVAEAPTSYTHRAADSAVAGMASPPTPHPQVGCKLEQRGGGWVAALTADEQVQMVEDDGLVRRSLLPGWDSAEGFKGEHDADTWGTVADEQQRMHEDHHDYYAVHGMGAGGWATGLGGLMGAALIDEEMGDGTDDTDDDDVVELEMGGWRHVDVESSYEGPRPQQPEVLDREFVLQMLEHFRAQHTIHMRYAWQIVDTAFELLREEPTLVPVHVAPTKHITVCGDVHGQFYDLLNIFAINGMPSEDNPYVFNGDFVDRGSFSVEVVLTLLAFKAACAPGTMTMIRGNHESQMMNLMYGFHAEAVTKYGDPLALRFRRLFCHLPLAACLNSKVLVLHGGLFSHDDVTLADIAAVDRVREPPDDGLMAELLWSDPMPSDGRAPNVRGMGVSFGPDVTRAFLEKNNLSLLVRSHEVKADGYEVHHDGQLVTIFSAPNYCDRMDNKGALIRFGADMVPHFTCFDAVAHPDVPSYVHPGIFY